MNIIDIIIPIVTVIPIFLLNIGNRIGSWFGVLITTPIWIYYSLDILSDRGELGLLITSIAIGLSYLLGIFKND